MRSFIAVAMMVGALGAQRAEAQVEPINWCPGGAALTGPPTAATLERAHTVTRTTLANARAFAPSDLVATLELTPAPRRRIAIADPELRVAAGDFMTPMIVRHADIDVLNYFGMAYCAVTAPAPGLNPRVAAQRNGVCVTPNQDSDAATNAFPALLSEEGASLSGRMSPGGGLGRGRAWATLGEAEAPGPAIQRSLRLGRIVFAREPEVAVWNRPAFNGVTVQFEVEGFSPFTRRLNVPLRIEDGWLVVTDITPAGAAVITRMTDVQWRAFRAQKCPASARP